MRFSFLFLFNTLCERRLSPFCKIARCGLTVELSDAAARSARIRKRDAPPAFAPVILLAIRFLLNGDLPVCRDAETIFSATIADAEVYINRTFVQRDWSCKMHSFVFVLTDL